MRSPLRTELTLPSDAALLPLARAYLREVATLAALPEAEADRLLRAAEEACANVIDHAYDPGETGTLSLSAEITAAEVSLSVRDQGLPFDPTHRPDLETRPDTSPARTSKSGGLSLIRQAVDRAFWISHGHAGKELRLVKYRPQQDIRENPPEAHNAADPFKAPLAPEQEYTVRCFQPEDALGIARCIYRVYGYSYMHQDCYFPDRVIRMNETGELVSVVAADASGEVVGHYALERPGLTRVAERGIAVVDPAHRGRDLMGRMRIFIEEEARRLGLTGVYSMAVTQHVYSQRVNEEFGSTVCGILLGGGSQSTVFKKMHEEPLSQRVSWVLYYTHVQDPQPGTVYAPDRHRPLLERIYEGLRIPAEWGRGLTPEALEEEDEGEVTVLYNPVTDSGTIRVPKVGCDTAVEVCRAARDLIHVTGAEAVYLELPLAQRGTPAVCEAAEREGFFFAGVGPAFAAEGDALLLQRLAVPLDPARVQLANPFARELLEYAARERDRVREGA